MRPSKNALLSPRHDLYFYTIQLRRARRVEWAFWFLCGHFINEYDYNISVSSLATKGSMQHEVSNTESLLRSQARQQHLSGFEGSVLSSDLRLRPRRGRAWRKWAYQHVMKSVDGKVYQLLQLLSALYVLWSLCPSPNESVSIRILLFFCPYIHSVSSAGTFHCDLTRQRDLRL